MNSSIYSASARYFDAVSFCINPANEPLGGTRPLRLLLNFIVEDVVKRSLQSPAMSVVWMSDSPKTRLVGWFSNSLAISRRSSASVSVASNPHGSRSSSRAISETNDSNLSLMKLEGGAATTSGSGSASAPSSTLSSSSSSSSKSSSMASHKLVNPSSSSLLSDPSALGIASYIFCNSRGSNSPSLNISCKSPHFLRSSIPTKTFSSAISANVTPGGKPSA
mmetsp:Transcript_16847/g.25297  ORF Transcript_16847/g.25297 Transcript_16847/m.25297 type:complete len:221 (+) Transcript_16847:309-971(+)